MDEETRARLEAQTTMLEAIYTSVEKTRKYFQVTLWITVIMFVLPLLGIMVVAPMVMDTLTSAYQLPEGI